MNTGNGNGNGNGLVGGYHLPPGEFGLEGSGHHMMQRQLGTTEAETEGSGLRLEQVLSTLRRRWWIVVLFAVVGAGAAFVFSKAAQKQYTATSSVLFQTPAISQQAYGLNSVPDTPANDPTLMATDLQLLANQGGLAAQTARTVGHGVTAGQVSQAISISEEGQTTVADVSATTTSPSLSAAIANAYATRFVKNAHSQGAAQALQALKYVQRQLKAMGPGAADTAQGQTLLNDEQSFRVLAELQKANVELVSLASVPSSPSSPNTKLNTAIGGVIGLLLGLILAFVIERLDRRIKSVEELEAAYRLPLLATVPERKLFSLPPDRAGIDDGDQEVFRLLHAYLRYFNVDSQLHKLMIASATPGDGKSTVSRNLAQAAQETGTKTILIEADMRLGDMARTYGISASPGLSELLVEEASLEDTIRSIRLAGRLNGSGAQPTLDVLVAGTAPPNPTALLESKAMVDLLAWASENYELVIIDTPPLSVVADAITLTRQVDGVIVVSRLDKNTRDSASFLRERLDGIHAPLLGVVANGVKAKRQAGYGYGYGYGHGAYSERAAETSSTGVT